jgi:transposase
MKLFSGAVSVDEKGRTGLVVYVVAQRRKAVMKLYNSYKGNHYNLIAKILGISVATIENDVRHYYASRNLKKHDKKKAAFTAMTSENLNP